MDLGLNLFYLPRKHVYGQEKFLYSLNSRTKQRQQWHYIFESKLFFAFFAKKEEGDTKRDGEKRYGDKWEVGEGGRDRVWSESKRKRERERVKDDLLPLFVHQEYNNNIKKIKKHKDKANLGQS